MSFFAGPSGPARSTFRTARGFASFLVALFLVFFFLYAYQIYSVPQATLEPINIPKPRPPIHGGLSDSFDGKPLQDSEPLLGENPSAKHDDESGGEHRVEHVDDGGDFDFKEEDVVELPATSSTTATSSTASTSSTTSPTSSSVTSSSTISTSTASASLASASTTSTSTSITASSPTPTSSSTAPDSVDPPSKPLKITQDENESGPTGQDPQNHNEYTTTIVVGRVDDAPEGVAWIHNELKDITKKAIYIVDDPEAPLHLNKNKGRESMVYMKYILEFYHDLSDVTIFFHSSRMAWHNNMLDNKDGAVMINNLRRSHVMEQGYFNMRCELYPGCPRWIKFNANKTENAEHPERFADLFTIKVWDQLFPNRTHDPVYLAQPCCSQFALSRERIQSIPYETFVRVHDFIAQSKTGDGYLGRLMEYVWQYLFLDQEEYCPSMQECYCKGYGQCLPNDAATNLVEFNHQREVEEQKLSDLGMWDRKNCDEEDPEKQRACKKENPHLPALKEARQKAGSLKDSLLAEFGIKDP